MFSSPFVWPPGPRKAGFRVGDIVKADQRIWIVLKVSQYGLPCTVQLQDTNEIYHDSANAWGNVVWTLIKRKAKKNIIGALDNVEED